MKKTTRGFGLSMNKDMMVWSAWYLVDTSLCVSRKEMCFSRLRGFQNARVVLFLCSWDITLKQVSSLPAFLEKTTFGRGHQSGTPQISSLA